MAGPEVVGLRRFRAEEVIEQSRVQENDLKECGSPDPHRISRIEIEHAASIDRREFS
ncbi:hypothetical protein [Mycobacterium sp.]|uniref:hypothetical protein n=1 Tax=Mycobacterium sp. TaxID=1785 RepID=UPI00334154F2